MLPRFVGFIAIALIATTVGCATYIGRAKRAYAQGRYLEVSEELGGHEEDLPYLDPQKQIEYGIYRGLALMMLGDYPNAHRWLAYANQTEKENPGSMRPDQRVAMERGFSQLTQGTGKPGEVLVQPPLR